MTRKNPSDVFHGDRITLSIDRLSSAPCLDSGVGYLLVLARVEKEHTALMLGVSRKIARGAKEGEGSSELWRSLAIRGRCCGIACGVSVTGDSPQRLDLFMCVTV